MLYGKELTVFFLGDQWLEAGLYVQGLSLLGLGTILKGLVNIIHINEVRAKELMFVHILSLGIIYPISFSFLFVTQASLLSFTKLFGAVSLTFWFGMLVYTLLKTTPSHKAALETSSYAVLLLGTFTFTGIGLRSVIHLPWIPESIITTICSLAFTALVLWFVYPSLVKNQYVFIRDRLKWNELSGR